MGTSERGPSPGPRTADAGPEPQRDARSGSSARALAWAAVVSVILMAVTGTAVYGWQHAQVRDRDAALAAALQERDDARQEAAALRAAADLSTTEMQALEARVAQLEAIVKRLRSTVEDLNRQLGGTASCNASDILASIRAQVDIGPPLVWDSVSIQECQGGYARVYAHPGNVPAGWSVEDSEQVFLRSEADGWVVITSGTGISCADSDLSPDLERACTTLGLR